MAGVQSARIKQGVCTGIVLFFSFCVSAEQRLVSWEEGLTTPSGNPVAGLQATLNVNAGVSADSAGSADGSYGTFGSGASVSGASFKLNNTAQLTVTLQNNTTGSLVLDALRFDFLRRFPGSPKDLLVTYDSGNLGAGPVILFQTNNLVITGFDSGDYPDFDILLAHHLSETNLAPGESAVFSIVADNASAGGKSMLDNFAFTGSAAAPPQPMIPLLGWTEGSGAADTGSAMQVSGFIAVDGSGGISASRGSTDGSYGSIEGGAPVSGGSIELFDGSSFTLSITNELAARLRIDQLNLDFSRRFSGSPTDVSVAYESGDLDDGTISLGSLTGQVANTSDLADYADLDCELRRELFDIVLDQGESALFRVSVSGASGGGAAYVDNVGIYGELMPYEAPPPVSLPTVSAARHPNVLIFYADDIGVGDVSAYGYGGLISTPNIDALASGGMLFRNAHTVYGTCAPSRYGVLSGNLSLRGRRFNGTWQPHHTSQFLPGQKSLGDLFQEAGYRTSLIGKLHMGGELYLNDGIVLSNEAFNASFEDVDWLRGFHYGPTEYGFDYTFLSHDGIQDSPYMYHENDVPVDHVAYNLSSKEWTWAAATNQPYLFLQKTNAVAPGYISIDPDSDGVPGSVKVDEGHSNTYGYAYWDSTHTGEMYVQAARNFIDDHVAGHSDKPFFMHFCSQCVHVPHTPDTFFEEPVEGTELTKHLDMVHEMDLQVKALVDKLKEHGLENDTIIIFTSDNGGITKSTNVGHQPSGPFRGSKGSTWEGGHRVPFIVRWGDGSATNSAVPPATACERVISQADLFATFATLLDLPQDASQGLDSMNVLPYFMGRFSPVLRDHLVAVRDNYAFHLGGWKIISTCNKSTPPYAPVAVTEMYHLETDPSETTNLAGDPDYASIQARLFAELTARVTAARSTAALDADGDGLFDAWEMETAGNLTTYDVSLLTSNTDSDGDGVSDGDEYVLRSNPAVADAAKLEADVSAGAVNMAWRSRYGRYYQVEHRGSLTSGNWIPLPETYIGNGEQLQTVIPVDSSDSFFRCVVEP
jgi:arylsulfatase A-like enzyme